MEKVDTPNMVHEDNVEARGPKLDLLQHCHHAVERSPMPIAFVEGPDYVIIYANPAFCRIAQKDEHSVIGLHFGEVIHQDAKNESLALLDRVYHSGKSEMIADQEHVGSTQPLTYWSYAAWPELGEHDEPIGVTVQLTDTTEASRSRVCALALNEALVISAVRQHEEADTLGFNVQRAMTETHHRVKNHLQAIAALADMPVKRGRRTVSVSALHRIAQHVHALAVLHDVLTQQVRSGGEAAVLDSAEVLDRLISLERSLLAPRQIYKEVESIRMPAQKVGAFSMIANEMLNNAIKHSAGDIEVTYKRDGRKAALSVSDYGDGFPEAFDPQKDANTGLELIQTLARYDLRGDVQFSNNRRGGACITVTFPVAPQSD